MSSVKVALSCIVYNVLTDLPPICMNFGNGFFRTMVYKHTIFHISASHVLP